jgi:hypothetical protein
MLTLWRVRAIVCLWLAVSTAIGAVNPARACACATPARPPAVPAKQRDAAPRFVAKSCCPSGAQKRSCCSPAPAGTKSSCCGDKAPADRSGKPPTSTPADTPGCHCLRCECEIPAAPPAPAPTAPVVPDFDGYAVASPVPTDLTLEPPTAASRPVGSVTPPPPTDLVISLSRFTC